MALLSKARRRRNSKTDIIFICVMLAIPLAHFALFWIYINIDTVFLSFKTFDFGNGVWKWVGMQNYRILWRELTKTNSVLPRAILNSFSVFLWNDFVIVPISMFCAYVLYKKMPLGGVFKVIFFLPSIISVVVLVIVFSFMLDSQFGFLPNFMDKIGLGDKVPWDGYLADKRYAWWMVLIYGLWSGIGYNIVLFTGAMTRIPQDVVEAGKLDGLTMGREFFSVTIPMIGSTIGTLLLMGTTVIFSYFLQPKLLMGANAEAAKGYTIALYIVNNVREAGTAQIPLGAAIGIICAIIGTPIVFICRKFIDKFLPAYEY